MQVGRVILFHKPPEATAVVDQEFVATFVQMKSLSDEDLMEHLKRGHHDALALLFDRYYRLVLNVARDILRDSGEAEDLMQEVFFEIYRVANSYDSAKGSVKTWVLQYAYHRSLNRRHYLNVRNFYDRRHICDPDDCEPHYSPSSWNGLTFQEWVRVIRQGLSTLNEKQRETLELACFQGLLLTEIAERMNESPPNVRHYYYRGLKKLRDFLQDRSCFEKRLARSRQEVSDDQS